MINGLIDLFCSLGHEILVAAEVLLTIREDEVFFVDKLDMVEGFQILGMFEDQNILIHNDIH